MAALIVCLLCALVIMKPQEFVPALADLPLLYVVFALAVGLVFVDVVRRHVRLSLAPQIPFVVAFLVWGFATTALKRPDKAEDMAMSLAIVLAVFLSIALGAASSSGLKMLLVTFLGCGLLVTTVAIAQGLAPFGCVLGAPEDWGGKGELVADGRPCVEVSDCHENAPVPEGNYRCERVGPLGTSTAGGRVRYRGSLADPNELTLMIGMALPFAFAFAERKRRPPGEPEGPRRASKLSLPLLLTDRLIERVGDWLRALPVAVVLAAAGFVVVLSQSRTGLIVYLLVLGAQFVRRAGAWGVIGGSVIGPPMLLLGGRSGSEADASSDERVELLREAFQMIRTTKGVGVGAMQFSEESSIGLTAHNSYVLAAAEAGLVGLFLFGLVMYFSIKVPFALWFGRYRVDANLSRLAPALAVSLSGAALGIFFLSWSYKDVLYMMLGASAALYSAARAQDPTFRVRVTLREVVVASAAMVGLLLALYLGLKVRG